MIKASMAIPIEINEFSIPNHFEPPFAMIMKIATALPPNTPKVNLLTSKTVLQELHNTRLECLDNDTIL